MLVFDSHTYIKKLIAAGCDEKQAEVHAETLKEIVDKDLATKSDLKASEERTKSEINANTDRKIAEAKVEIIKWVFGMFFIQSAFLFGLFKFFAA